MPKQVRHDTAPLTLALKISKKTFDSSEPFGLELTFAPSKI
jgi:hypothetical protein